MFQKILIANRGEIAVRIIRACREMGIRTIAVYSKADEHALHTQLADQRICIGPKNARDSYLNMDRIISAAKITKADAIHPGFGFLSENSEFARKCEENDIVFIGPSPEVMDSMGNKSQARNTMEAAGVPVVPGTKDPIYDAEKGKILADRIGYPVMVKASAGGGGKGMRIVSSSDEFISLFNTAQKETVNAFGDDTMYIEKYIQSPRHIEFQILGDQYGHVIHLGERDCSLQRKHQKLLEESPSPALDHTLRKKMGQAAVKAAKAVGYYSAGTIEFLLDQSGAFYFMEMNTRIQVEHPVTEMVTGVDLIEQQIRVAAGEPLSYRQEDIRIEGHAIECRINAEIPEKNFMPSPGTVTGIHLPGGNGVRVDTLLYSGCTIPAVYDSMIAKVIVHGKDRDTAIRKMRTALYEMVVSGVSTNIYFQYQLLDHPRVKEGTVTTAFIEEYLEENEKEISYD